MRSAAAGGHVETEFRAAVPTRETLEALAMVGLAGRAADVAVLGTPTAGAQTDLAHVTGLLARLHLCQGLGEQLVATPEHMLDTVLRADPRARALIDSEMRRLLARATEILLASRDAHARLVVELLATRIVPGERVRAVLSGPPRRRRRERVA